MSATTTTPDPTTGDAPEATATRLRKAVLASNTLWIFLALVLIIAIFSMLKPSAFLSSYDIKTIFINASVAL